jgi:hypothetical protein
MVWRIEFAWLMSCRFGTRIVGHICTLSLTFVQMVETRRMHRYMLWKVDCIRLFIMYSSFYS